MAATGATMMGARPGGLAAASLMGAAPRWTCRDWALTRSPVAAFLSGKSSLTGGAGTQEEGEEMQGKIALEEHFAIEDTLMDSAGFLGEHVWEELKSRLLDIHVKRIGEMDRHGVEIMILSLNAPAVQAIADRKRAYDVARKANDFLAEQMAKNPKRFQAFAALPMQDPEKATREYERCV